MLSEGHGLKAVADFKNALLSWGHRNLDTLFLTRAYYFDILNSSLCTALHF